MTATALRSTQPSINLSKRRLTCRAGYAAHGIVYLLVGLFAIDAAVGGGESARGSTGAIATLGGGVIGTVLLTVLAAGLFAYSYMMIWQGTTNPEGFGRDAKGIWSRIGSVVSALGQAALGLYALSIAYGWFSAGGSESASGLSAQMMSWPGGRWIVGAVGVGIGAAGIAQLSNAVRASFLKDLSIRSEQRRWIEPLGRVGFASRFVVFATVGVFVVIASYQFDPDKARGFGGALRALRDQPYGPWLLGAVGVGLVAFAAIRGVYARYAVIPGQSE